MQYYRLIPSFDRILEKIDDHNIRRSILKKVLNQIIFDIRENETEIASSKEEMMAAIQNRFELYIKDLLSCSYRKVINCTGIILHTNLGRAPYSCIIDELNELAKSYINLEMDISTGKRTGRLNNLRVKAKLISGFEDCLFVNNNAAALMLILNTVAKDKEAIISRGELVEIGGSFRVPDIIGSAQAGLKEVGTTNCTNINDYSKALTQNSIILKVHKSNYSIIGHISEVPSEDLIKLARQNNILFYEDRGSMGFEELEKIKPNGNYILSFSMDKLAGAVQAGIILASESIIKDMKANPLYRALRLSKFPLLYLDRYFLNYIFQKGDTVPYVLANNPHSAKKERIDRIYENLLYGSSAIRIDVIATTAYYGGGAGAGSRLKSYALSIDCDAVKLDHVLRNLLDIPVITRIEKNNVILDIAAVPESEDGLLTGLLNKSLEIYENEISAAESRQ